MVYGCASPSCIPDVIVSVYGYGDEFVEDSTEADGLAF